MSPNEHRVSKGVSDHRQKCVGVRAGDKYDEEAFPDLVSLNDAGRLYGSADRVLDIIKLERLALGAILIIRQLQMDGEPLRLDRLRWSRTVHER